MSTASRGPSGPRSRRISAQDWPSTNSMTMKWRRGRLVEAEVEHLDDVRVHEPRRGQRLAAEARDEARVLGQVLGEQLDRDVALQPRVERELHGRHAADAEAAVELVAVCEEWSSVMASGPQAHGHRRCSEVRAVAVGVGVAVSVGVGGRRRRLGRRRRGRLRRRLGRASAWRRGRRRRRPSPCSPIARGRRCARASRAGSLAAPRRPRAAARSPAGSRPSTAAVGLSRGRRRRRRPRSRRPSR